MNAADRRRLTPLLGAIAVVLALLLIALWAGLGRGSRWYDADAPKLKLPPVETATPPPVVPPLEKYAEVWQHPVFSPTRTPEPAAGGEDESSGDLQLTGVIIQPGLEMAILHDKATQKDYRLVEGEPSRAGPVLVELHPRSAVVEASGSRRQLQLTPGPSPDAGNAPAPAGAQRAPQQDSGAGSAMVSRPGSQDAGRESAAARVRALKARIEAQRRKAQQKDGSQ